MRAVRPLRSAEPSPSKSKLTPSRFLALDRRDQRRRQGGGRRRVRGDLVERRLAEAGHRQHHPVARRMGPGHQVGQVLALVPVPAGAALVEGPVPVGVHAEVGQGGQVLDIEPARLGERPVGGVAEDLVGLEGGRGRQGRWRRLGRRGGGGEVAGARGLGGLDHVAGGRRRDGSHPVVRRRRRGGGPQGGGGTTGDDRHRQQAGQHRCERPSAPAVSGGAHQAPVGQPSPDRGVEGRDHGGQGHGQADHPPPGGSRRPGGGSAGPEALRPLGRTLPHRPEEGHQGDGGDHELS